MIKVVLFIMGRKDMMESINITNGEFFTEYIRTKLDGIFIPFNEAMIEGCPEADIFSSSFIEERCRTHSASLEEYNYKFREFFNIKDKLQDYSEIVLWFGHETFCQINMLTVLAYLEQRGYKGSLYVILVDDYTREIVEQKHLVTLGKYEHIYKKVLCGGAKPDCMDEIYEDEPYLGKAIDDYLSTRIRSNR